MGAIIVMLTDIVSGNCLGFVVKTLKIFSICSFSGLF